LNDLARIRNLVGDVKKEQLRHVDYAVTDTFGIFMPVAGQCYYAISPEHTHPSYLFTVTFDTYCSVKFGGQIIDSEPSTMFLIPPGFPHQELPSDTVSRYLAVMINKEYFEQQLTFYNRTVPQTLWFKPIKVTDRLVAALKEFMAEYEEASPGFEQLLSAVSQFITHQIIRLLLNISHGNEKTASRMNVNKAIEYINAHYGENVAVSDLAHVACLSLSHFTRIFKSETGMSPADYIMNTRLDYAKRMLRTGDAPVTTVALQCGFNSSSYFSHCFLRTFKTSPSQFKKSLTIE
jgi:AraC-like DNA-binding protein